MITESNDMKYNAYPHSMFAAQPEEDGCSKKGFYHKSESVPKSKTSPSLI